MGYLLLFQSRGLMRAQDFAATFEISERTVYRDIQTLCEVGVPISAMPGEGYRLMEGYYLPPIAFSPDEARSLYSNEITERDVEPLELAYIERTWILSAYCRLRQDQRAFRTDLDPIRLLPFATRPKGISSGSHR
jgi:predicted DNA-binding transcriptional regulator YafY